MNKESVGGATHDEGDRFYFLCDQHICLLTISDPSSLGQEPVDQGQGTVFSLAMGVIVVQC